jgi:hypothetical protein
MLGFNFLSLPWLKENLFLPKHLWLQWEDTIYANLKGQKGHKFKY